jgi:hypothetical protein
VDKLCECGHSQDDHGYHIGCIVADCMCMTEPFDFWEADRHTLEAENARLKSALAMVAERLQSGCKCHACETIRQAIQHSETGEAK